MGEARSPLYRNILSLLEQRKALVIHFTGKIFCVGIFHALFSSSIQSATIKYSYINIIVQANDIFLKPAEELPI